MTREEEANCIIGYLKKIQKDYIEGEGYEQHPLPEWYALDDAIELLERAKWIPISERLPKEKGLYLVSVKNDHKRRYSKTCWFNGGNSWFARQDVIAWMPLPQPYKESEV